MKITEAQSKELKDSLEDIIDLCGEGASPNEAIVKVAKARNLSEDRLPILVRTYNIGATAQQWQGDSISEKTASFPLADIDEINSMLYSNEGSVKSASYSLPDDDNAFSFSPSTIFSTDVFSSYKGDYELETYEPMKKNAAYEEDKYHKRLNNLTEVTTRLMDNIGATKEAAYDAVEDSIKELGYAMSLFDSPSGTSAIKAASAIYGDTGAAVVNYALERFPRLKKEKRASLPTVMRKDHPFYKAIEGAIEKMGSYIDITTDQAEMAEKCAASLKPYVDERKESIYGTELDQMFNYTEKKKLIKRAAGGKDDIHNFSALENMLHPNWRGATEREYSILNVLDDPEHKSQLERISVEAMLADLINTDPFLKEQDPEAVLDAYNDIIEVNPEIRNKKMPMRQALREYLATEGLDLSTINQLHALGKDMQSKKLEKDRIREDAIQRGIASIEDKEKTKEQNKFQQELSERMEKLRQEGQEKNTRLEAKLKADAEKARRKFEEKWKKVDQKFREKEEERASEKHKFWKKNIAATEREEATRKGRELYQENEWNKAHVDAFRQRIADEQEARGHRATEEKYTSEVKARDAEDNRNAWLNGDGTLKQERKDLLEDLRKLEVSRSKKDRLSAEAELASMTTTKTDPNTGQTRLVLTDEAKQLFTDQQKAREFQARLNAALAKNEAEAKTTYVNGEARLNSDEMRYQRNKRLAERADAQLAALNKENELDMKTERDTMGRVIGLNKGEKKRQSNLAEKDRLDSERSLFNARTERARAEGMADLYTGLDATGNYGLSDFGAEALHEGEQAKLIASRQRLFKAMESALHQIPDTQAYNALHNYARRRANGPLKPDESQDAQRIYARLLYKNTKLPNLLYGLENTARIFDPRAIDNSYGGAVKLGLKNGPAVTRALAHLLDSKKGKFSYNGDNYDLNKIHKQGMTDAEADAIAGYLASQGANMQLLNYSTDDAGVEIVDDTSNPHLNSNRKALLTQHIKTLIDPDSFAEAYSGSVPLEVLDTFNWKD